MGLVASSLEDSLLGTHPRRLTTHQPPIEGSDNTVPLDLNELRELLTALNQTDIAELTLKSDDFELTVRRGLRSGGGRADLAGTSPSEATAESVQPLIALPPEDFAKGTAAATSGKDARPSPLPPTSDRRLVDILSPMVGTFYRSPTPDEPPFVGVGDRIRPGQTVCIIEAMKLMNELEAEVAGEIVEILVQNAESVEYGQPLMRVNPI
jgi:acetyl-CoA carboxylase biotin carboxyl carrier protein